MVYYRCETLWYRKGHSMKKGKRSNGEGTIRQLPDGRWEARFMIGRGNDGRPKYKYLSAKTQRELRSRIKAWQEDVSQGIDWGNNFTFSEWADHWFEGHKDNITATTQESYRYTLRVLKDHFGARLLDGIKAYDIEEFLKKLRREGASNSRLTACRGMLFQIFHKAEANDLVHKNPVRFADKMRSKDPVAAKESFTAEEVKLLMQALGVDLATIQSIVGHADMDMTKHYLHVQDPIRQAAVQKFSDAFGNED